MKINRIGLVSKLKSPEASKVALDIGKFLKSKGCDVVYTNDLAQITRSKAATVDNMAVDLAVIVGGDGTVLRTAQKIGETPILGVKVGALGFLCETTPETVKDVLEKVLAGRCYVEHKTKLKAKYKDLALPDALNEVLVTTSKPSKIMSLSVLKDGAPLHRGKADGVIISTTTGSTAYALSAGGPIIDPKLVVMEVVFICPLSAGLRPIIFPSSSTIEVRVLSGASPGIIVLDGQTAIPVDYDVPVIIERSENSAVFIKVKPPEFYKRIREKIKLGLEV
jgi:NAD+ kinase